MIEVTKPRAIALGYFDGVHLGHRALMQKAVERAKQIGGTSAVFTFDVHPDSVVMGRQVPLLTANAYRREEIKQLGGVDEVIFGHFDERMQHMDWRDFIHKLLIGQFHAGWIISGRNNRFGYKGQGNAEGMAVECEKAGIGYDCIEDVKVDGIVVSSTYIRQLIAQGDMEGAAKFLGHPYTVTGIVEHGRRVGTSVLGVPTVNLRLPTEMALPPYGVYATRAGITEPLCLQRQAPLGRPAARRFFTIPCVFLRGGRKLLICAAVSSCSIKWAASSRRCATWIPVRFRTIKCLHA